MPAALPANSPHREPSTSLLEGLRSGLPAAWQRLRDVYAPVIVCWCQRHALQSADIDDIVQDVFSTPGLANFRRDQGSGSFVAWLFTITRSRLVDWQRRQARQAGAVGGSDFQRRLETVAEPAADDDAVAFEHLALRRALDLVQPKLDPRTWAAFWRVVVDGQDVALVAAELNMKPGTVRVAKCRVLQRLRDELE